MDAYVFVAFFFPLFVMINFGLVILCFFLSLWVGFGDYLADYLQREVVNTPTWLGTWLREPPFSRYTAFYPLLLNVLTIFAVASTYSLGYGFHSKGGWKWFQPGQGGIRFVLFQIQTWFCLACSLCFPWMTVDEIGVLQWFQHVSPASEDRHSHGGLLLMSSVCGILSLTFALCGLLSYDSSAKKIHRLSFIEDIVESRQEMETGKWNFDHLFGDNEAFWWMFVALEICVTFYSCTLALLVDYKFLENRTIQVLALVVYIGFLTTTVSITNSIGGKWRHGTNSYKTIMPFQGGMSFMILQGVSWTSFSLSLIFAIWKIYNVTTIASSSTSGLMRLSGFLGLLSELFLVASLFLFDPTKVDGFERLDKEETDVTEVRVRSGGDLSRKGHLRRRGKGDLRREKSESSRNTYEEHIVDRIIGKRPSPKVQGTIEYLVQWRAPYGIRWENQPTLMKKTSNTRAFVMRLINAYESQLADMVNQSALKDKEINRKSRSQRRRSKSPHPERKKSTKVLNAINIPIGSNISSNQGEIWEECEDELGNTFYFSVTTGESVSRLPDGYRYTHA